MTVHFKNNFIRIFMQNRPVTELEQALINVENVLPTAREGVEDLKKRFESFKKDLNSKVFDINPEDTHLNDLVTKLEQIFIKTKQDTIEKNILARAKTAIYLGKEIVANSKSLIAGLFQPASVNSLILGMIHQQAAKDAAKKTQAQSSSLPAANLSTSRLGWGS
jgi:hypothetical protein